MKTVGIIGGLGPETTAEFYLGLVFGCYEKAKEQRPPILIWNVPLDLQVEEDLLLRAEGVQRYIPYLTEAAQRLEGAGAEFLVMPCNTLHIFIDELRQSVGIPVLSIVEETAMFLSDNGISRVGILATPMSLQQGLYEGILRRIGIEQVVPDGYAQAQIGEVINRIVRSRLENRDRESLLRVIKSFETKGVQAVILACTDLQLLIPSRPTMTIYDTMKIFAEATVETILERRVLMQ